MAPGHFASDREAMSYGFYPGTLFSNKMDGPPPELWSEPTAEGFQPSPCAVSPSTESCIPMPRFLGRMQQQPEPQVHGDGCSRTSFPAWATYRNPENPGMRAGSVDQCFPKDMNYGYGQAMTAAAGLGDATYFCMQGSATETRSGHRYLVPRLSLMQLLEKSYTTSEKYTNSCYQRSGYPPSNKNKRSKKERHSKCDYVVPLTRGRSQDSREDGKVSQKDQESSTNVSSLCPSEANEDLDSGSLLSAGAVWHAGGRCVPCKFFRSKAGCKSGLDCEFCHYPHQELSRSQLRSRFKRAHNKKSEALCAGADSGGLPCVANPVEDEQKVLADKNGLGCCIVNE
eukprot:TRINITY_DN8296_c1_g1_i1.p1 TRINITY_DN8296_c1_g1~~TRINITY_DN8296_c1_g1_i1.p1  ORF type:complete len:368 (+),score=36.04 TRINITY_DN8296_c1_g1_i1:82-1104(+)